MRDLVAREALKTMARDAARLFRELIASGKEIPYEVRGPGEGSPLARYEPLTERFVRDHAGALRELDSFGAACAALEAADLAAPYLEHLGIPVPPEGRARAELCGVVFLCRLWMDSTDFSLDTERLDATVEELEARGEAGGEEIDVVVPLRGLTMPAARLELGPVTIVRADTVDVPPEVRAREVMGASPWEPTFLAVARVVPDASEEGSPTAGEGAGTEAFHRLVTTLRLFKAGGVGLGPYAWVASAASRWRRIATGAGKPRQIGYRLGEGELGELVAFSQALASPETPFGRLGSAREGAIASLGRAISRFEAGLERPLALEALNDNLLALRFVLEGGGPASLGLAMRVAALCAEPGERGPVKTVIERAESLERALWSGEPANGGPVPAETAARLEHLTRSILRDAACGHLGGDLRTTADEILLADGLSVGDGAVEQRGETAEWGAIAAELGAEVRVAKRSDPVANRAPEPEAEEPGIDQPRAGEPEVGEPEIEAAEAAGGVGDDEGSILPPGESEPEPVARLSAEPRIEIVKVSPSERRTEQEPSDPPKEHQMTLQQAQRVEPEPSEAPTTVIEAVPAPADSQYADPASAEGSSDAEGRPRQSPVLRLIEQSRAERAERAERLANLFPRPETEWSVRELGYDRRRRAEVAEVS